MSGGVGGRGLVTPSYPIRRIIERLRLLHGKHYIMCLVYFRYLFQ